MGVTYDAGALVAAERNDRRMWALHAGFLAEEVTPVVPSAVLAQAWRGAPRQASLVRFLLMCETEALTDDLARRVGVLAAASRSADIADLSVVEGALRRQDAVCTSDAGDLRRIAEAAGTRLVIESV
jgi:hypothetical protein